MRLLMRRARSARLDLGSSGLRRWDRTEGRTGSFYPWLWKEAEEQTSVLFRCKSGGDSRNPRNDLRPFSGRPKLWNYAPITSHLICITLITTEQATLSVNANLLINKLIRQLQLCRRMPKWNMTTQSLSTAPVGLFRCHNEKYDDKVASPCSPALIPAPGSARLCKISSFYLV